MSKKRISLLIIWLIIINFPYIYGILNQTNDLVFGGFLLNPIDGNSYLAKIQQGYNGKWTFQLPYTSQENSEVYLFVFYNLIGQFSRIVKIDPIMSFHLFRLLFSVILFFTIDKFLTFFSFQSERIKEFLFLILIFGSGLGWLYIASGDLPVDLYVAEAFPFLSAFTNPHFPLAISLIMWILILANNKKINFLKLIKYFAIGFVLANISPFAAIISGSLLIFNIILNLKKDLVNSSLQTFFYAIGSAPIAIYQYMAIKSDPILAGWNNQNVTPAPNLLNLIFSFFPLLIGIIFIVFIYKPHFLSAFSKQELFLIAWISIAIIFIYLPFDLQRRFLVGFYIPVIIFFGAILDKWVKIKKKNIYLQKLKFVIPVLFTFSVISNILIISGAIVSIRAYSQKIYFPRYVLSSAQWIKNNCLQNSVILSGPDTGLLLPSYTFSRTVFGHPFETINATETKDQLLQFWTGEDLLVEEELLKEWQVDYIFYGKEEKELGHPIILEQLKIIYQDTNTYVYEVNWDE